MSYSNLSYEKKATIGVINIIGPIRDHEKMAQLFGELTELCNEIERDEEVRVIILAGFAGIPSLETNLIEAVSFDNEGHHQNILSFTDPIFKFDRPVIAAVKGDAIAQGLELALACDIRIVSETSHFGLPHIKTGFIPWDGGTQRLSRLVGSSKALEMILTGEVIDALEALRIGLVHKVVPKKDLTEVALKMAQEMASKGPIALRYIKEAIYKGMDMTLEQGLRLEADLYLLIHTSQDRTEGIQAFREKRKPQFEGR